MVPQLGALAALAQDLGLIPSTHMAAHNSDFSFRRYDALFWPPQILHAYTDRQNIHM